VIDALARGADRRVGLFFEMIGDLLVPKNFVGSLDFFTASFTTQRDDLGQWRAYAENGKGFALGLAPRMFEVVDGVALPANELSFVGQVLYDRQAIFARHENPIAAAASIFLRAVQAHAGLLADKRVGIPFMRRMANELIASPLIWNCITSKHIGYANEHEVRLILMNQTGNLAPYVEIRRRGSEIVPYIAHPFAARSTIASNTGSTSPSDELMTPKTSAIAASRACASSRSAVRSSSRHRDSPSCLRRSAMVC
jgi:hypothetical protein